jgi:hypothetical protein
MPKGYIGESKSEKAINKMAKWLEKSEREQQRRPVKKKDDSLLAQIKENNPDDWRDVLDEMSLEAKYPEYLKGKKEALEQSQLAYMKQTGMERAAGPSREAFIEQWMNKWKIDNNPTKTVK